mmetsp:Transcript_19521/g.73893  ORF Transcript_19521/g.73893 Transcript_19521/m.73893 type:complete len:791 (-) Transcript_19521:1280-3652(-)
MRQRHEQHLSTGVHVILGQCHRVGVRVVLRRHKPRRDLVQADSTPLRPVGEAPLQRPREVPVPIAPAGAEELDPTQIVVEAWPVEEELHGRYEIATRARVARKGEGWCAALADRRLVHARHFHGVLVARGVELDADKIRGIGGGAAADHAGLGERRQAVHAFGDGVAGRHPTAGVCPHASLHLEPSSLLVHVLNLQPKIQQELAALARIERRLVDLVAHRVPRDDTLHQRTRLLPNQDFVAELDVAEAPEAVSIPISHGDVAAIPSDFLGIQILEDDGSRELLQHRHGRVRSPIWEDEAVAAKLAVSHSTVWSEGPSVAPGAVVPVRSNLVLRFAAFPVLPLIYGSWTVQHPMWKGFLGHNQALVDQIPDETTLHTLVAFASVTRPDEVPVDVEPPSGVAHGVAVLAENDGTLSLPLDGAVLAVLLGGDGSNLRGAVVHGADHVGHDGLPAVPFKHGAVAVDCTVLVLDRERGARSEPLEGRLGVRAVAALVAQAQERDAGVVLGAFVHGGDATDDLVLPQRIAHGEARHTGQHEAVRLAVRFVQHQQAVLVAELIPPTIVGIVAGAHRGEVVLLEEHDVPAHRLFRHQLAGVGIMLVSVDACHHDGAAIQLQHPVLDGHLAESNAAAFHVIHVRRFDVVQLQHQCVERNPFVGPLARGHHVPLERHSLVLEGCWIASREAWWRFHRILVLGVRDAQRTDFLLVIVQHGADGRLTENRRSRNRRFLVGGHLCRRGDNDADGDLRIQMLRKVHRVHVPVGVIGEAEDGGDRQGAADGLLGSHAPGGGRHSS